MRDPRRAALPLLLLLLLLLAAASNAPAPAGAVDVIASSKLEACVADGAAPSAASSAAASPPPLACTQKLVLTVAVDASDAASSSSSLIELAVTCVGSPTGSCPCPCDYARDQGCGCRDLERGAGAGALTLAFAKTPVYAAYPLTYLQSFNWRPTEQIIRPQSSKCRDGDLDSSPTCGWYLQSGQRAPGSQGFCCECAANQVLGATLGTTASATERTRANLNCDFFSNPLDILSGKVPSSAHCLQMDPKWYGGYGVAEPAVYFEVEVSIARPAVGASNGTTTAAAAAPAVESIVLSPATPSLASANRTLSARLQGDLLGYGSPPPVLSSKILMIPRPLKNQTLDDVFSARQAWLLVDRARVSLDGRECDRVGTSFLAFRDQANACRRAPRSCLANQLADLAAEDQARVLSGKAPLYSLAQFSRGVEESRVRPVPASVGGAAPMALALPVPGGSMRAGASLVTVEVAADGVRLVTNASPGRIAGARVCAFGEGEGGGGTGGATTTNAAASSSSSSSSCSGSFEAMAAGGFLHAAVSNTGTIDAAYTLSVSNCTPGVVWSADAGGGSRRLSVRSNATALVAPAFQLTAADDGGGGSGGVSAASPSSSASSSSTNGRACWLVLRDSLGRLADGPLRVAFATSATQYSEASLMWKGVVDAAAKYGEGDGAEAAAARRAKWGPVLSGSAFCGGRCGSLFDVACFAGLKCWGGVGAFLGSLAVPVLGAALLWVAVRRGWLLRCCGCCCSRLVWPFGGWCLGGGGGRRAAPKPKKNKRRRREEEEEPKQAKRGGGGRKGRKRREERAPSMLSDDDDEEEEWEEEEEDERPAPARSPRRAAALPAGGRNSSRSRSPRSFASSSPRSASGSPRHHASRSGGGGGLEEVSEEEEEDERRGRRQQQPPRSAPQTPRRERRRQRQHEEEEEEQAQVHSWDPRTLAAVAARLPPGVAAAAAAAAGLTPAMQRAVSAAAEAAAEAADRRRGGGGGAAAGHARHQQQRRREQQPRMHQERPVTSRPSVVVEELFSSNGGVGSGGGVGGGSGVAVARRPSSASGVVATTTVARPRGLLAAPPRALGE